MNTDFNKKRGCCLCFWGLSATFTTCNAIQIRHHLEQDRPPYADILLWHLNQYCSSRVTTTPARFEVSSETDLAEQLQPQTHDEEGDEVSICIYCFLFLKDRMQGRRQYKHAMHLAITYIMSGGCTQAPSAPLLERCLQTLHDHKDHPFRSLYGGRLHEYLLALHNTSLNVVQSILPREMTLEDRLCILRWLFEGASHIFNDSVLARNTRRCINKHGEEWLKVLMLPSACCHCSSSSFSVVSSQQTQQLSKKDLKNCYYIGGVLSSYNSVLVYKGTETDHLEMDIKNIESQCLKPGLTFFCGQCSRVSVIHHAYYKQLRQHLQLPVASSSDAYYTQICFEYA